MEYTREQIRGLDWTKCPFPVTSDGQFLTRITDRGLKVVLYRLDGSGLTLMLREWGDRYWFTTESGLLKFGDHSSVVLDVARQATRWVDAFIERSLKEKWIEQEIARAILGEEAMNEHNHKEHTHNWPPPKHELDKFRYVSGNYVFVLESLLKGTVTLTLQYTFGVRSECHPVASTEQDYDWSVSCRFKYASAVAAAIPRAEVFLRNLYEKQESEHTERAPLPDGCDWINSCFGEITIRDNRYMALYALPLSERQAAIFDALAKEFRRTHPEK